MKAYTTILDGEDALLPFFVRHYRRLGAREFPLLVYGTERELERAAGTIEREGGIPQPVGVFESRTFSARLREAEIRRIHTEGEWAFFADLDEFADTTPEAVLAYQDGDAPFVAGHWIDRVSYDGRLVHVREDMELEEQFPMKASLRQAWGMGAAVYVLSPFAPRLHHPYSCEIGQGHWPRVPLVNVHHFKWQVNAVDRLQKRLERIELAGKTNTPWGKRVQYMVTHLKLNGGIHRSLLSPAGSILGI
jgi:hypothetical protein